MYSKCTFAGALQIYVKYFEITGSTNKNYIKREQELYKGKEIPF